MTDPRATAITVDPTGLSNVTATDVQGAIEDLDVAAGGGGSANYIGRDTELLSNSYTTITLDSTPVANGETVFVNSDLFVESVDYTISGAVISLTNPVFTGSRVTVIWQTTNSTPGGFTMSGTPASPTLRGSDLVYVNNTSSQGINLPAGSAAGDRAVLFASHGYGVNAVSGWTSLDSSGGSNINGAVFTKILDSADITAGSVTVTFGGSYYGEVSIAVAVGPTAGVRETKTVRSSSGASPNSLTTSLSASGSDLALYYGSIRTSSSTTTVDRGTSLQSRSADTEASAALYSEDLTSSGTVTAIFSHSPASNGYYEAIVILKGA